MKQTRPIIGVTTHRYKLDGEMCVHPGYTASIEAVGGLPVIIPLTDDPADMLDICDGFLLTGSVADVNPELYHTTPPDKNFSDHERDRLDFAILEHAQANTKPVMGICRGCQMMNVFRGGSLALHFARLVETDIEHCSEDYSGPPVHKVTIEPEAWLSGISGEEEVTVNSIHRQVCHQLGKGLRVAAVSEDGLIEAIEDVNRPELYFAVQWHPERRPGGLDDVSLNIFRRFVDAC